MNIILFLVLLVYAGFHNGSQKNACNHLQVFFMGSFRNDSVSIGTNNGIHYSARLKTDLSTGQAHSFLLNLNETDTVVIVQDITQKKSDSVNVKNNFPYLYIYYSRPKFVFSFSKELLKLE